MTRLWMRQALCVQVGDPDLWFPTTGGSVAAAKKVCRRCPVIADCETEWLSLPPELQRHGIWAGRSVNERKAAGDLRGASCPRCGVRVPGFRRYCSDPCRRAGLAANRRRYEARRVR